MLKTCSHGPLRQKGQKEDKHSGRGCWKIRSHLGKRYPRTTARAVPQPAASTMPGGLVRNHTPRPTEAECPGTGPRNMCHQVPQVILVPTAHGELLLYTAPLGTQCPLALPASQRWGKLDMEKERIIHQGTQSPLWNGDRKPESFTSGSIPTTRNSSILCSGEEWRRRRKRANG